MAVVRVALISLHVQKLASCLAPAMLDCAEKSLLKDDAAHCWKHPLVPLWSPTSGQDEGHKVKNPHMKLAAALRRVPARLRVIISGTPIQVGVLLARCL